MEAYLLAFIFHRLPGSPATKKALMQREVERVYATLLTRVVRYPNSRGSAGKRPIFIVAPDFPVPKHRKKSLQEVTLNDGLHLHAIALIPPESRLKEGLDEHFAERQDLYVGPRHQLASLHATPITKDPHFVVDYAFKALKRRRASPDDIVIFPRSETEFEPVLDAPKPGTERLGDRH